MTTVVDSNIIVALLGPDDFLNRSAIAALKTYEQCELVMPAPVYAELLAGPQRTEAFLDAFCEEAGITIAWDLDEMVWRAAGLAFQGYAARRRRHGHHGPRQILTDFLIGAFAMRHKYQLLTLDRRLYRAAFPGLKIIVA